MQIAMITTGFIDVPGQISLNIFAQGCEKRCIGCQNADLQPFSGGITMKTSDIPALIEKHKMPTWICWLGGDAIYQQSELVNMNTEFKKHKFNICLYTGKYFNEIDPCVLNTLDLIIDGPWEETCGVVSNDNTNQKCYMKMWNNKWKQIDFKQVKAELSK